MNTITKKDADREYYLDHAKFIGIVLVVWGHAILLGSGMSETSKTILNIIYSFHMPLFFVLSGFTLSFRKKEERTLNKSIKKILIPYFLWSFLYIFLRAAGNIILKRNIKDLLVERLYAVLSFRGIAPIWFLGALFLCKLFFNIVISPKKEFQTKNIIFWMSIFLGLSLTGNVLLKITDVSSIFIKYPLVTILRFFPSAFFLVLGYYIGVHRDFLKKHAIIILLLSCLIFTVYHVFTANNVNMHLFVFSSLPGFFVSGISGSIMILALCIIIPKNLFIQKTGQKSLDIMLLHYPPIPIWYGCKFITEKIHLQTDPLITALLLVMLCYFVSITFMDAARKKINSLLMKEKY